MSNNPHRVRVIFQCGGGHRHELCVPVTRGVPQELRCIAGHPQGFGGSGGGCAVPPDLADRVAHVLARRLEESRRQGFVLVQE